MKRSLLSLLLITTLFFGFASFQSISLNKESELIKQYLIDELDGRLWGNAGDSLLIDYELNNISYNRYLKSRSTLNYVARNVYIINKGTLKGLPHREEYKELVNCIPNDVILKSISYSQLNGFGIGEVSFKFLDLVSFNQLDLKNYIFAIIIYEPLFISNNKAIIYSYRIFQNSDASNLLVYLYKFRQGKWLREKQIVNIIYN